jgi:hypothetical protein
LIKVFSRRPTNDVTDSPSREARSLKIGADEYPLHMYFLWGAREQKGKHDDSDPGCQKEKEDSDVHGEKKFPSSDIANFFFVLENAFRCFVRERF